LRHDQSKKNRLVGRGHPVVAIGAHSGRVAGIDIVTSHPWEAGVDTVTLYINPRRQPQYVEYILALKPRRVIFNPGTENEDFAALLEANGIQAVEACTLVMLSANTF
jgi:predicted CoA-binding protein